jgi:hypothetical protein
MASNVVTTAHTGEDIVLVTMSNDVLVNLVMENFALLLYLLISA